MTQTETSAQTTIHARSVARNSVLLIIVQVFARILGFFIAVLLANYLGVQLFGAYNYAFAFTALFIPFCDLGMDMYLFREIPRRSRDSIARDIGAVLVGKCALTIVVILLIGIADTLVEGTGSEHFPLVILAGIVTIMRTFWTTFSSMFRAIDRVADEAILSSITRMTEFAAAVICVVTKQSVVVFLFALGAVNLLAIVFTFMFIRRRGIMPVMSTAFVNVRNAIRQGLPFALTTIFVAIYFNFDTVLVSKLIDDHAAGIYRAAYNLILPLLMVTAAVSGALFPFVSQNFQTQGDEVARIFRKSVSRLLMIAFPVAVITTILAPEIIGFLFKSEYAASSTSLAILIWFIPVAYLTNLYGFTLGAMNDQPYVLKISMINVAFNIGMNFLLIPRYAQNGAAIVTVLTELVGLVLLTRRISKTITPIIEPKLFGKIIFASLCVLPLYFVKSYAPVLASIAVGLALYGGVLLAIGGTTFDEIVHLFTLVRGSRAQRQ